MFFSIITPVYNSEKFLKNCIDSVLSQSFEDFELICINDGSTDGSKQILEDWAKKDSRLKIFSKINEGQGVARNFALQKAAGEHVLYLDSDDWLEPDALLLLKNKILKDESDIIFFNNYRYSEETGIKNENRYIDTFYLRYKEAPFCPMSAFDVLFYTNGLPFKVYKREFLVKNDIKYSPERFIEDSQFYIKAMLCAKKISCLNEYIVNYRVHPTSTTAKAHKNIAVIEKTFYECEKIFEDCKFPDNKELENAFLINRISQLFYYFGTMPKSHCKIYYKMLKCVILYINKKYGSDFIKTNTQKDSFESILSDSYHMYKLKKYISLGKIFLPHYIEI